MNIIWLGHSGFRIEIGDQVLLVDPWITGNPMFPADRRAEAISGVTAILVTHGHGDHSADAVTIGRETGAPVVGTYDLTSYWDQHEKIATIGFNKGGTVRLGDVAVTLVAASHSSAFWVEGKPVYAGTEAGFMISGEGRTIYVSGDTDIMADMAWMGELHAPDIGILACGGHFTMDMARAAWAARRYFKFRWVIPCHYRTFPLLEQSAEVLIKGLPGVQVIEPQVLTAITLPGALGV
jgi:L-ascorbate metabolism protein UlaG (beta-lactamase superfamily)